MNAKSEYSPLIILGQWNKAIFSPDWAKKYLFPDQAKLSVEIPLNIDASLKFSTADVSFSIIEQKLLLTSKRPDNNCFPIIEKLALELARFLPHTPVFSFGINHVFVCPEMEFKSSLFELCDTNPLISKGLNANLSQIKRSFILPDSTLNFTITKTNEQFEFDFNYHFDLKSFAEFPIHFQQGDILLKKTQSFEILKALYDLNIQEHEYKL